MGGRKRSLLHLLSFVLSSLLVFATLLLYLPLKLLAVLVGIFRRSPLAARLAVSALILVCATGLYLRNYLQGTVLNSTDTVYLYAHAGESAGRIFDRADSLGLSISPLVAKVYSRITGIEHRLLPGRYTVTPGLTRSRFLELLRLGRIDYVWITIPEGLPVRRTFELLARGSGRSVEEFDRILNNRALLASLPLAPSDLEGYLFPETYKLPYLAEPQFIIRDLLSTLDRFLGDSLRTRARGMGLGVVQILTLASLIEAETGVPEERPLISSVFHNRLSRRMRLQCDPTVIYALGGLDRPLTTADLSFDSPYNTYLYSGLPPGPINSPGRESILAALYPAQTEYLYFVADLSGRHQFSATLAQHEKARQAIKRKRRLLSTLAHP